MYKIRVNVVEWLKLIESTAKKSKSIKEFSEFMDYFMQKFDVKVNG